ncbi:molybdopterin converting factor subunit 1 [Staphylococcus carnosus]|uniref:molybdopterin converting factor subunit 1 n=1 Tax=Staphylococcus carnosus TaxID=1281 RepID=UPI00081A7AFB|nr:molybdopterin converting factor subunit 1 [Staphylococcus carnosus]ANZ32734.1 molybdopterin converting factor subunit 1 [Staphylococcus carnosus]UTB80095.1 molybdopterin converting factor subunit 1 [Staphylococcus carnosus]UTB84863.1 molybdopterin converting factor subunit 1 [Staphylococcus carnosus]
MKVLYFAEIKEILQKDTDQFQIDNEMTVEAFKQYLFEKYPEIDGKKFQIALNEEFVQPHEKINQSDVVALIPPVSGG